MKRFLLVLFISLAAFANSSVQVGGGMRGQFAFINNVGPGFGVGGHLLVGRYPIFFYPNIDFWYAWHNYEYDVWDHDHWDHYVATDYHLYEMSFNMDAKFAIVVSPVSPYMGFGLCPVITSFDDGHHNSYANFGFNAFGGIGFGINRSTSCFFEIRGKMGNDYNVLKMSFGMTFYGS